MIAIDRADLTAVTGAGESRTRVDVGPVHYDHVTSDYQACLDRMHRIAEREHPSNAIWPFTPDTNAAARARAEAQHIERSCGRPSQSSPPRLRRSQH